MRYSARMDALVEDALKELEHEFEGEFGAEFQAADGGIRFYKWVLFLPVWNASGDTIVGWERSLEEFPPRQMSLAAARDVEKDILSKWARQVDKKVKRIAIRRCFMNDQNKWQQDLRFCNEIDLAKGLPADSCGRVRPKEC